MNAQTLDRAVVAFTADRTRGVGLECALDRAFRTLGYEPDERVRLLGMVFRG